MKYKDYIFNDKIIELALLDDSISIYNKTDNKAMIVLFEFISNKTIDVWNFQADYLKLPESAVKFIEKITEDKIRILL
jgi:hypothetical protein